jgi:4-carboxymuconolactone decarboxylase
MTMSNLDTLIQDLVIANRILAKEDVVDPTSSSDEREQVVYEIATALTHSRWVPKGLYDRAVKALGHVGITDAITLMGYYTSVSMTLAFYDVPAGASGMAR